MMNRDLVLAMSLAFSIFLSPFAYAEEPAAKIVRPASNVEAEEEEDAPAPNPRDRVAPRQTPVPPAITTIGGTTCPFRPNDPDILAIWEASRQALAPQAARNQQCRSALESMSQTMGDPTLRRPDTERVRLVERISQKAADVETLRNAPDANPRLISSAEEELARLQGDLRIMDATARASSDFEARQATLTRLSSVFESITTVQAQCEDSDESRANVAVRTGFSLFSAAAPLLFGPGSTIEGVANVLSSFARLFSGPNMTDRALDFINNTDDLNNVACLYFFTQKKFCEDTSERGSANRVAYANVLALFEDTRVGGIGRRMRRVFENVYGKDGLGTIYEDQSFFASQMCAMMSNIPNAERSGSCRSAPTGDRCAYINYYKTGVTPTTPGGQPRNWPSELPSSGFSTFSRGGGGSR